MNKMHAEVHQHLLGRGFGAIDIVAHKDGAGWEEAERTWNARLEAGYETHWSSNEPEKE